MIQQLNVVGNGVVIDPVIFKKELENLDKHNIDYTDLNFNLKKSTFNFTYT